MDATGPGGPASAPRDVSRPVPRRRAIILIMATSRGTNSLKCDHGLRRRVIVQSLLVEVFQGRLRAGQHLVTQELADRFGVSPTPIREALIALEGIGIVDLLPNRGAVIRRVT